MASVQERIVVVQLRLYVEFQFHRTHQGKYSTKLNIKLRQKSPSSYLRKAVIIQVISQNHSIVMLEGNFGDHQALVKAESPRAGKHPDGI